MRPRPTAPNRTVSRVAGAATPADPTRSTSSCSTCLVSHSTSTAITSAPAIALAASLFAAAMRIMRAMASFEVKDLPAMAEAEVLGGDRTIPVKDGGLSDAFEEYGVHLYRIR